MQQAALVAYRLRIDPVVVLEETDSFRRKVRAACAVVIGRELASEGDQEVEDMTGG